VSTLGAKMATREAIELFKAWMRDARRITFTGRVKNANRLARILPLYQAFVLRNLTWFEEKMGYVPTRKGRRPGQLAHIYPFFRDHVLLQALREIVAEHDDVSVDEVPPMRFFYKKQCRRDGCAAPRSVVGWERA
jgi:hypothetical protein